MQSCEKSGKGIGNSIPYGKVGVEQQTLCDDADAAAESAVVVAFRRKECNVLNEKGMKEYNLKINGNDYRVVIKGMEGARADVEVNGKPYEVAVGEEPKAKQSTVAAPAAVSAPAVQASAAPAAQPAAAGGTIKSPLPGVIMDIRVAVGDTVSVGQCLMVLEAMKMENNVDSDKAGTVREIRVATGDSVLEGDVLIVIEN